MCFLKIRRQTIDSVFSKMAVAAILKLGELANFLVYQLSDFSDSINKTNKSDNFEFISVIRITLEQVFVANIGENME